MVKQNPEEELVPTQTNYNASYGFQDTQSGDLIQWELDPKDVLESLEHNLRGEVWDKLEERFVQGRRIPLVNDNGINTIMTILEPRLSKLIVMSNYNEEQIKKFITSFADGITVLIAMNYKDFGIQKDMRDVVVDLIVDTVHATYLRALKGGERTFLRGTLERKEVVGNVQGTKKGGFLGF